MLCVWNFQLLCGEAAVGEKVGGTSAVLLKVNAMASMLAQRKKDIVIGSSKVTVLNNKDG